MTGRQYPTLAVILKEKRDNDPDKIKFVPFKVIEGDLNENEGVFMDKNGYNYFHVSELRGGNCYNYLIDINYLIQQNPGKTLQTIKKEIFDEASQYQVVFTLDRSDNSVELDVERVFGSKRKYDYFNIVKEELIPFIEQEETVDFIEEKKETKEIEKKEKEVDIRDLYKQLKSSIIGQDEAIRVILATIWHNTHTSGNSDNILAMGPTGVGKTAIFRIIAKALDIPIVIANCPDFTASGFVGDSVTDILDRLIENANGDVEKASKGIVILDEFDKISKSGLGYTKVNDESVQNGLLKLTEDGDYERNNYRINTSNITFAALGAFSNIEKQEEDISIGFNKENKQKQESINLIDDEQIIKYGIIPELLGRFPVKVSLKQLAYQDIYSIILNSNLSKFKEQIEDLKRHGIVTEFSDDIIEEIAKEVVKKSGGARAINSVVSSMMNDIIFKIGMNPNKYKKLSLKKGIVKNNKNYELS